MRKLTAAVALLLMIAGCRTAAPGGKRAGEPATAAGATGGARLISEQQAVERVLKQFATSWPDGEKFPRQPGQAETTIGAGGVTTTLLPATFETAVQRGTDGYLVTLTMRWREGEGNSQSFAATHYAVSSDGAKVAVAGTESNSQSVPPQLRK